MKNVTDVLKDRVVAIHLEDTKTEVEWETKLVTDRWQNRRIANGMCVSFGEQIKHNFNSESEKKL